MGGGKKHHQVRQREEDGQRPTMRPEGKKGRKSKESRERNRSNRVRTGKKKEKKKKKGETWELWGKLVWEERTKV